MWRKTDGSGVSRRVELMSRTEEQRVAMIQVELRLEGLIRGWSSLNTRGLLPVISSVRAPE